MTDTQTTATGGARPRPSYAATKVEEMPENLNLRTGNRGARPDPKFLEAAEAAMNDPGQLYELAVFQSRDGAKNLLKKIVDGKITLPGEGEWEVDARRVAGPNHTAEVPQVWSKLFAKYHG